MKKVLFAVVATALAVSPSLVARADDFPSPFPAPVKSDPAPVKPVGNKVTIQEVGQMLEAMGYNPKPVTNNEGKLVAYNIAFQSGTWNIYATVEISPSTTNLWFVGTLVNLKDQTEIPVEAVLGVLEENYKLFPAYIYYTPATKRVELAMPLPNVNVTAASFRAALEQYTNSVKQAVTTWQKGAELAKVKKQEGGKNPLEAPLP